jgi:hypothetical protein
MLTVIRPLAHNLSPMLVQHLAGAATVIRSSLDVLKKGPQVVGRQVKGRFLSKEDLRTILHFGGVAAVHFFGACRWN